MSAAAGPEGRHAWDLPGLEGIDVRTVSTAAAPGPRAVAASALAAVLPPRARLELGLPEGAPCSVAAGGAFEPFLLDDLASAQVVHLTETDAAGRRRVAVVLGDATLLVVRDLDRVGGGDEIVVETAPASALPLVLARFAGLHPGGRSEGERARLRDADLAARLADPTAPAPADAPAWLREAWGAPWRLWSVEADGLARLDHVDAGPAGQLRVRLEADGHLSVASRPDGLVWGDLQRVPAVLHAARGELDPEAADW